MRNARSVSTNSVPFISRALSCAGAAALPLTFNDNSLLGVRKVTERTLVEVNLRDALLMLISLADAPARFTLQECLV